MTDQELEQWCVNEREQKLVRLRIFAYHIHSIIELHKGERLNLSPVAGLYIIVRHTIEGNFFVNDKCSGNVHGAVEDFTKLVHEYALGLHPDNE